MWRGYCGRWMHTSIGEPVRVKGGQGCDPGVQGAREVRVEGVGVKQWRKTGRGEGRRRRGCAVGGFASGGRSTSAEISCEFDDTEIGYRTRVVALLAADL